ncbi:MAG: trans-sulfuration enzyme family protein, partial [Thermoplasmata archaeon]
LYGGTRRIFESVMKNFGVNYVTADMTGEIDDRAFRGKRMIWLETPSNPMMKVIDIRRMAEIAQENSSILVVDNTFASPYFQNPLKLGADIVLHSTTKYINGHSDSLGGAIMVNADSLYEKIKFNQNAVGAVLSPFDSFLTLRGIKTLEVRMERHQSNAMKIAEFLERRGEVECVYYPGLQSFRYRGIAKKQMRGYGGMLSFHMKRKKEDINIFLKNLKYFSLAESLGGVESLIEIPYFMTHSGITEEERKRNGIKENLIRVSVGLEDVNDLIIDLEDAFRAIR